MTTLYCYLPTALCVVLIFILSFFSPPHTPLDNVAMIDKWTHFVMYGGTVAMFWLDYWRAHYRYGSVLSVRTLIIIAFVVPILLGGLIELAQAYCTGGRRSGEWLDLLADAVGVLMGDALGLTAVRRLCCRVWKPKAGDVQRR